MKMTVDQAIVELRGLDPYAPGSVTDAQEEAARTVVSAVERVRELCSTARPGRPTLQPAVFVDDILRALDGAP